MTLVRKGKKHKDPGFGQIVLSLTKVRLPVPIIKMLERQGCTTVDAMVGVDVDEFVRRHNVTQTNTHKLIYAKLLLSPKRSSQCSL